ncbi:metallophosphoesterase [Formosa agariphila KMM 3901]|uniref:Metallophosphoesterase n=1 Tax=Formosa agariphila (strain DSM 15362 / KCTC 12365 / LMG 23005 / KMM 3901 / M-2Alg 35-1) TaxID=1347342 RepID=T2KQ99_FORAG|nr:metallophosphoesterase [Formosa agariphila]CDF80164.1 metallophosphoesterase [Formosa agariphila KMM 3901]
MNKILLLLFFISLTGCATLESSHVSVSPEPLQDINTETLNVFLVGDAGKPENGKAPKALLEMEKQFALADKEDLLFFLGDNIYPKGFPAEDEKGHDDAKLAMDLQLEVAKKFPGSVYVIPGNHDWYSGLKGLKRQEKLVEDALGKNTFQPEDGCGIERINISDDVVLILVDSQWYITNWNRQPTINDDCDIKTREQFLDEFKSEIKKARGKTTLVAIHHPMFSNGPHNGQYTFADHMKPLPVLGTVKNILRTTTGISNADMSNWFYNDLRKNLIASAQQNDNVIFISGHEHSLQFIQSDNLTQIISGSGSKTTGVRTHRDDQFGLGANGYAVLNIHKDQASDVQFVKAETNAVVFKSQIHKPEPRDVTNYPKQFTDSISSSVFTKAETTKSSFYKFLWGERFRDYYSTDVQAKTVNLDTLKGGLKPVRKGGGTQSRSLRLEDKDGTQYVMRALRKSATQYIQASMFRDQYVEGQFDDTETEALVADVFTGAHPYAPLTIGVLSDAVGVYHLNPELYYMPKQNGLMDYNDEFGNELYFFEEHASEGHMNLADGNFTGEIISTMDLFEEIHSDEDVAIDQVNFIKSRLFDMLIGDWDRHYDQWRWLEFKEDGKTIYKALPRDRDQAFSKMSEGLMLSAGVALIPAARVLRSYDEALRDVKGVNAEPYPLDVAFLTDIDKSVWDEQVAYIQKHITDEVINEAFSKLPKEVQDESVLKIKDLVKSRRKNLKDISDRYFKLVSKFAVVTGTNKDDYVSVKGLDDGKVEVSVLRKKDDTIKDLFHHKIYDPKVTKEIWVYGLDDDDTFKVSGKSKRIKIRLIGGQNNDDYQVEHGKNIVIYDYKSKKNTTLNAKSAKIKLTDDYETQVYNYKKFKNNTNQLVPLIGANPDDGLKLGVSNTYTTYGFERNPFTSQHKIKAAYYFATNGYEVSYSGEFAHVVGHLNLKLQADFQSPNYTLNFFGYGNETSNFDDDLGIDYNRVKVRTFGIAPSLVWNSLRGSIIDFGIHYETTEVHNASGRYVEDNGDTLPDYIFDEVQFAGIHGAYHFTNYDNKAYPTVGLLFDLETGYSQNLDIHGRGYGYVIPKLGLAHRLNYSGRLVLATTLKAHLNIGNEYEFYQAAAIGGDDGLRGFRNQRFTGKRAFYQNTDIRYSLTNLKTPILPVKLGVYGSFDYGRVWLSQDETDKWHNSYGGGLFVNGAELLTANLGVFNSVDGVRVSFGLGFGF